MKVEDYVKEIKELKEKTQEQMIKEIKNLRNPYPKDIFVWDNKKKCEFNKGRFNQHCFEIWENCRKEFIEIIQEEE